MLDGGIVGTASVIITADTSAFRSELEASSGAGMVGVEADADASAARLEGKLGESGLVAGTALSSGLSTGAKDIGKDTEKDLEASTGRMQGLVKDTTTKMGGFLNNLGVPKSLTTGFGLTALGIAGVSAFALKAGIDLQTADSSIATSEGISTAAAKHIGDAFLSTAGDVEYSAREQATAFGSVAGQLKTTEGHVLTAGQSLTFMKANMDLATASGQDLGMVTQTTAGIMQAFQVPLDQVTTVTNTLFNASNATGQSIDTLGASFEKTRAKLGAMAPPLQDLAALVLDMTKNGITGRAALTGLNTAFTALQGAATGTTTANLLAKKTFEEYGVSITNAKGQLVPMSDIIDKLAPKYATMTQAQQLATSATLFGSSAAKQMTAVIDGGTSVYQRSVDAITKHNAVEDAAALKAHTLSVEFKTIESTVEDFAAQLGELLIPALQILVGAIEPVLKGLVDVVTWFEKGSAGAHILEGVLVAVLAPAILKMGADMVTSAAKAVASFVTMSGSAKTAATEIGASDEAIVTTNTEAAASFEEIAAAAAADIPGIGASMASISTEVSGADGEIVAANEAAGASFTALAGVAAAGIISFVATTKLLDYLKNKATVKQSSFEGAGTLSQNAIVAAFDKAHGIQTVAGSGVGSTAGTGAPGAAIYEVADKWYKAQQDAVKAAAAKRFKESVSKDAFIAPPNTAAQKAAEEAAKKATEEAKKAGSAATSEAKKAAATLTSAVLTAIKLPADEATKSLTDMGVPAKKASAVLHDAVLPFTQAVKALEKAGFDAQDAVKIAEAGASEVAKANKAAAAAATKAVATAVTNTTATLSALTVNGIAVSGAVYRAAIGAAYQIQTGQSINANIPTGVTPTPVVTPIGPTRPTSPGHNFTLNVQSGAVVIHPAPGNDAESNAKTQAMIDAAFQQLTVELRNDISSLQVTR